MARWLSAICVICAFAGSAHSAGLLIPTEKKLPPLAMVNHFVNVEIDDQVAVTKIEQTFRNHTDRQLEAEYIFPIPKGASVRKFVMWVDGKAFPGETVEADKARTIYTEIVRRTLDPGLLEYMGGDLIKLRVFPVLPKQDQKILVSYTSVANSDAGLIEYIYPMKTNNKAASTLEKFSVTLNLKSQHSLQNIYSPTHAITVTRPNDRNAVVGFEKEQAVLDKDFQLFYTAGTKDVGLTAVAHRPNPTGNGYFMLLVSPRAELSKSQQVPRDMIFVLDTSGSMKGKRMTQARSAMQYCLKNLTEKDRFGLINFATTVNYYSPNLQDAGAANVDEAHMWVGQLEATGGTAIDEALKAALAMRSSDANRTSTIVFFTDGRATIGETNEKKILDNVLKHNSATTRIFTFGVGDDVNASMLDQLADQSRAVSTYVRESEDIEVKLSSLYGKISNPVLANLKLSVGPNVKISEVYPPQLPDLFHGTQLVVFGRYTGDGHAAIKVAGNLGAEVKEFVYEFNFEGKTKDDKSFVEDLWARRKVGYLLDQIRVNGDKKELVDEVVTLAKRYGITTPYTSFLVVPDGPLPVARAGEEKKTSAPDVAFHLNLPTQASGTGGPAAGVSAPSALKAPQPTSAAPAPKAKSVEQFAKETQAQMGDINLYRGYFLDDSLKNLNMDRDQAKDNVYLKALQEQRKRQQYNYEAGQKLEKGDYKFTQGGKLGVDLSCDNNALRSQDRLSATAQRWIGTRNCVEVGGVWIDEAYKADMKVVAVKAMSKAYFRLIELQPRTKDVFQISNHLIWVTPSQTALAIDANNGVEDLGDEEIAALFQKPKKK